MAHPNQRNYTQSVVNKYPELFTNKNVLDVGSLDINGNNRFMFTNCKYTGLDVGEGKNVDVVSPVHLYDTEERYDVIVSTECFEHDRHYVESLNKIVNLLNDGGIFVFTCATTGRAEHGTRRTSPEAAPLLQGEWSDYYKNLTEQDIKESLDLDEIFSEYSFSFDYSYCDIYFYGIKKISK